MLKKAELKDYLSDLIEEYESYHTIGSIILIREVQHLIDDIDGGVFNAHENFRPLLELLNDDNNDITNCELKGMLMDALHGKGD